MDGDGGLGYFPMYDGTLRAIEKAKAAGRGRPSDEESRTHRRRRHLLAHARGAHDGRLRDGGWRAKAQARPARLHAGHRLAGLDQRPGGPRATHRRRFRPRVRPAHIPALARACRMDTGHDIPVHRPGHDRPGVGRHHGGHIVLRWAGAPPPLPRHRPVRVRLHVPGGPLHRPGRVRARDGRPRHAPPGAGPARRLRAGELRRRHRRRARDWSFGSTAFRLAPSTAATWRPSRRCFGVDVPWARGG